MPPRPLLVIDGDFFAHRAYHGLPKSIRRAGGKGGGAIVGFANYLIRLLRGEQPRAVLVGWDTLEAPTWRAEAFAAYQGGRVFDDESSTSSTSCPTSSPPAASPIAKAAGYEADDFLAAAVAGEERRGGRRWSPAATATRSSSPPTHHHPASGAAGEIARIGPAEVRERYGVEPRQVPDFIALRGDPSDKLPGARGIGPKTAASLLTLSGPGGPARDGRFPGRRRISASTGGSRPWRLPRRCRRSPKTPTWAKAAALARDWELNALAERLARLARSKE